MTPEELSWRTTGPPPRNPMPPQNPVPPRPRRRTPARWTTLTQLTLVALILGWAITGTGIQPGALIEGRHGAFRLLRAFTHPDLSAQFLRHVGDAITETLQISLTGLLLAAILAAPTTALLAANIGAPPTLRTTARISAAILRGVPDLLWALLFVATIGPGPAAGTLAIALHGGGLLTKLGAEQLEAVPPAPVEAVQLTGANRPATAALAIIPQARAGLASLTLYQWECNIRTSTVLGFVGAGGIGQELAISLKLFRYDQLSTLIIAVLLLMLTIDALSRIIRRQMGAAT